MRSLPTIDVGSTGQPRKSSFLAAFVAANPAVRSAAQQFLAMVTGDRRGDCPPSRPLYQTPESHAQKL